MTFTVDNGIDPVNIMTCDKLETYATMEVPSDYGILFPIADRVIGKSIRIPRGGKLVISHIDKEK